MSWAHTTALVSFYTSIEEVLLDAFAHNPEWTLTESTVFSEHFSIDAFDESYPLAGFSLTLKRVPTYYVYNIIAPVLLLTLLSCLVYVMPAEAGEKVGLQITILLSFSVMLLIMGDVTPKAGKTTPLISKWKYCVQPVLNATHFSQAEASFINRDCLNKHWYQWPLLLTWFNFNPSMDK